MASIERLEHGITSLQKTTERRRQCLQGDIIVCVPHDIRLAAEPLKKDFPESSVAHPATADIFSLYDRASLGLQKPAVMLAGSACVPSSLGPSLYTLRREQDDLLLFVGDAFFVDTNRGAAVPFYRFFRDIGLPYWLYPPASTYVCPSIAEEYGRVWNTYLIRESSQLLPLSSYASGQDKVRLVEMEKKFASGESVLRESDAREYVAAGIAWAVHSPAVLLEALRQVESLALSLNAPGTGLAGSLRHLISELSANRGLLQEGVPVVMDARNLFYLRSGYFALFAGHAVSPDGAGQAREASYSDIPLEDLASLRSKVSLSSLAEHVEYFFTIHRQPDLLSKLRP